MSAGGRAGSARATTAGAARVRIRRARIADAAAIARVMRAAVRGAGAAAATYTSAQLTAWSSLPALYHRWAMTAGGETYLVAEQTDRVIGYAALRGAELTAAFVHPSIGRTGLGRRLVACAERVARRSGVHTLHVDAAPGAVPFYARVGYRGARRVRVPLPGGVVLEARRMRKRLQSNRTDHSPRVT